MPMFRQYDSYKKAKEQKKKWEAGKGGKQARITPDLKTKKYKVKFTSGPVSRRRAKRKG